MVRLQPFEPLALMWTEQLGRRALGYGEVMQCVLASNGLNVSGGREPRGGMLANRLQVPITRACVGGIHLHE